MAKTHKKRNTNNKTRKTFRKAIEKVNGKKQKDRQLMCQSAQQYEDEFVPFEKKLEEEQYKNDVSQIMNVEKLLIDRFNTPYAPTKVTANSDFYTYINYVWLKNTSKMSEFAPEKEKYFVQVDDTRVAQNNIYIQLMEYVKDYTTKVHTPEAKQIKNVYKSLYDLKPASTKKNIRDMELDYEHYTKKNNLWEFLAHINANEIVSWSCPINWSVQTDEKNTKFYKNSISFAQLSLYDYLLYIEDIPTDSRADNAYKKKVKARYLEYIQEMFDGCLGKGHGLKPHDVFDIEGEMLTAMGCDSVKNDSKEYYNVVKSSDALSKYGFDWEQFSHFLGYKTTPDSFICDSLSYLKCICTLMKENWTTPKWKSFWYYIYLKQMIRFDDKLRYVYFEFHGKFLKGQPNIFPQDLYPVFGLSFTFNTFLSREYVKHNLKNKNIAYVKTMAEDLLHVFKRKIKRNTWLSSKTKRLALKKLDHLKFIIAEPDNLRDDPLLGYTDDDAWGNMMKLCDWKHKKYIELNGKELIDIPTFDWNAFKLSGTQSYVANAYYTPTLNSIYIPLGYLVKPFIDLNERGIEYNLAHIGYTICHEMSHSLDESGSKYDHEGKLHNWWSKEDKIKYNKIIKDIIKQYEVYAAYDGIKFDAAMSIGEDMADISGLAICEEYLRDFQDKNSDVVPIASLSFQAFFVYFAVQQRQHVYKQAITAQLKTNPHPMDKYRTNVPLSRLELFRSLYNVKKGDKMWWHSANTIW